MPETPFDLEKYIGAEQSEEFQSSDNLLVREAQLLQRGIANGASQRFDDAGKNWDRTGLELGTAALAGIAANAMIKKGGLMADVAKYSMCGLLTADVLRRGLPTAAAVLDTAIEPTHFERNQQIVADNLGSAFVDYPMMMAAGYAGMRWHGSMQSPALNAAEGFRTDPAAGRGPNIGHYRLGDTISKELAIRPAIGPEPVLQCMFDIVQTRALGEPVVPYATPQSTAYATAATRAGEVASRVTGGYSNLHLEPQGWCDFGPNAGPKAYSAASAAKAAARPIVARNLMEAGAAETSAGNTFRSSDPGSYQIGAINPASTRPLGVPSDIIGPAATPVDPLTIEAAIKLSNNGLRVTQGNVDFAKLILQAERMVAAGKHVGDVGASKAAEGFSPELFRVQMDAIPSPSPLEFSGKAAPRMSPELPGGSTASPSQLEFSGKAAERFSPESFRVQPHLLNHAAGSWESILVRTQPTALAKVSSLGAIPASMSLSRAFASRQ